MALQGAQLKQHEELLRHLVDSNNALLRQVSVLTTGVSDLSAQLTHPVGSNPAQLAATASNPVSEQRVVTSNVVREPSVPVPERYAGDPGSCNAFLLQVSLVFELQPNSYASDRARVAYIISLLTGRARDWGAAVWSKQPELSASYAAFTAEMRRVFDHPVRGRDASNRLTNLRQGARSVADYAIEFRTLAAESGWNDPALQGAFYHGLQETLKDELATRDDSSSLDHLISTTIKLDNRLRERRRERGSRSNTPSFRTTPPESLPAVTSSDTGPEPMQLGRAKLTPQEHEHRRASNLCLYCGKSGHFIAACPIRPVKDPARR